MEFLTLEQMKSNFGNSYVAWRDFLFALPVNTRDGVAGKELARNRYMAGHALNVMKSNGKKAYDLFWLQNAQRLDARSKNELEGLPGPKHAKEFIDAALFIDWSQFDEALNQRAWEWMHQGAILSVVGLHWLWTMPEEKRLEAFWLMDEVGQELSNNFNKSTEVRNEVLKRLYAEEAAVSILKYLDKLNAEQLSSGPQKLHCAHVIANSLGLNVPKAKILVDIIADDLDRYAEVAKAGEDDALGQTLVAMRDAVENTSDEVMKKIGEDIGKALKTNGV